MENNSEWKCIYKTNSEFEAEAIVGNLQHEGITAVIINKKDSMYQTFGMVEIHVPELQAEQARELIDESKSDA